MIRKMTLSDREFYLSAADEFYHSNAVEKPLPMERLNANFDEVLRSDVYLEGLIIEHEGVPAGYCMMAKTFHTEAGMSLWIEDVYILSQYRGRGLGGELFAYLNEHYSDRFSRFRLEVEEDNTAAMALYRKNGFRMLEYNSMVKDFDI